MVLRKSPIIELSWYECKTQFLIVDDILSTLKELGAPWDGTEDSCDGIAINEPIDGIYYCMVLDTIPDEMVVLHESMHIINIIRNSIGSEVHLDNDETYVREVTWLQMQNLNTWKAYENSSIE